MHLEGGGARTLHTDIIVELLWLFATNKGAHWGNFRNIYDFADSCKNLLPILPPRQNTPVTAVCAKNFFMQDPVTMTDFINYF